MLCACFIRVESVSKVIDGEAAGDALCIHVIETLYFFFPNAVTFTVRPQRKTARALDYSRCCGCFLDWKVLFPVGCLT